MPDSPLTQRDVEALRTTLSELNRTVIGLPDKIESTYVRKDVYDRDVALHKAQLEALASIVGGHTSWLEWAQRIVIGLVIVGLVGLLIASTATGS